MFKILKAKNTDEQQRQYEMYVEIRSSLQVYVNELTNYNLIRKEFDETSTVVELALARLNHYRHMYNTARVAYEEAYGDKAMYEQSLLNLTDWSKKTGIQPLLRPANNPVISKR